MIHEDDQTNIEEEPVAVPRIDNSEPCSGLLFTAFEMIEQTGCLQVMPTSNLDGVSGGILL